MITAGSINHSSRKQRSKRSPSKIDFTWLAGNEGARKEKDLSFRLKIRSHLVKCLPLKQLWTAMIKWTNMTRRIIKRTRNRKILNRSKNVSSIVVQKLTETKRWTSKMRAVKTFVQTPLKLKSLLVHQRRTLKQLWTKQESWPIAIVKLSILWCPWTMLIWTM